MSYKINTTDGRLLVDLVDGRIDTDTTDLTLVGRNYTGYGEAFNENFVKLLENFANTSPPENPLIGQVWYDRSDGRLKVYNGTQFRSADTTVVSPTEPQLLAGDLWIDSIRKQLYFNDGSSTKLAGPIYNEAQGESGFRVESILDRFGNLKTVMLLLIGESVVALFSKEKFTAANVQQGFSREIEAGINIHSDYANFQFYGPALSTRQLISTTGEIFTPDRFLISNRNNITSGTLWVNNNSGITIGNNGDLITRIESGIVVQRLQNNNQKYKLKVRLSGTEVDAITVDTPNSSMGIWSSDPDPNYALDVNGSVKITGDLLVTGNTTSLEVENLRIQDKTIELAYSDDSSLLTNSEVNDSGILIRTLTSDKYIIWNTDLIDTEDGVWNLSSNINIPSNKGFRIGGNTILNTTTLASTVTSALGLTQIGQLTSLTVDNFSFDASTLAVQGNMIVNLDPGNSIVIQNGNVITGVSQPRPGVVGETDVANRTYVDDQIKLQHIYLTLDITGITSPSVEVAALLDDLVDPIDKIPGRRAYITTIRHDGTNSQVTINPSLSGSLTKEFVLVDKDASPSSEQVLKNITFADETKFVQFSPERVKMVFEVNPSGIWQVVS